jgi:1-deoxy-D-xylulose-5-phosphate reductoisomerase
VRVVCLLGSTGSIGTQAIDVIEANRDAFRVAAIAAGGGRPDLLAQQAAQLNVEAVGVADLSAVDAVRSALDDVGAEPTVIVGSDAAAEIAKWPCDVVLNGMDGAAGLRPTLAALESGRTLALANKESLIVGGDLVLDRAASDQIVPVDSEHSALAQCLRGGTRPEVRRLILTASGGPFRGRTREQLRDVTPAQALAHPTWAMGPLITTNSATLVNKGLEVIEAHLLIGIPMAQIEVVVHPQSVVHSLVEFVDGSTLAQASPPDMRLPIALALGWPDRVKDAAAAVDWSAPASWEFLPLDADAFPAVALARRAGGVGGTAPAVFNAANEVAVESFLAGRTSFLTIVDTIAEVLTEHLAAERPTVGRLGDEVEQPTGIKQTGIKQTGIKQGASSLTVDDVLAADAWGRKRAAELLADSPRPDQRSDRDHRGEP